MERTNQIYKLPVERNIRIQRLGDSPMGKPTARWALVFLLLIMASPSFSSSDLSGSDKNSKSIGNRKLINEEKEVTNRMDESCSRDDIVVYQGATTPLPNGIPTYTVQILNVCLSGAPVSGIHLSCGWFSSARLVNPRVFRRIGFDDCLVNDGKTLAPGESLSFQYANTRSYPLYVSSVSC